jgi:ankyrin repeat protein
LIEAVILGDGGPRHTETVRALVEAGANPKIPDRNGRTPLEHAEARGYTSIASILSQAGR